MLGLTIRKTMKIKMLCCAPKNVDRKRVKSKFLFENFLIWRFTKNFKAIQKYLLQNFFV